MLRTAFEFRHRSWLDDEVFEALRKRNAALCLAESENLTTPTISTADHGYLRLRREDYEEEDLARWADVIRRQEPGWSEVFVYFKHEEQGIGPKLAKRLGELLS